MGGSLALVVAGPADYSRKTAREIDDEIRRIVESAHEQAKDILVEHREQLSTISELLLERETIEREQFEALLEGKTAGRLSHLSTSRPRRGSGGHDTWALTSAAGPLHADGV